MRQFLFLRPGAVASLGLHPMAMLKATVGNPNHDPITGRFVATGRTPAMRAEKRGLRALYDAALRHGIATPESLLVRLTANDLSVVMGRGPGVQGEDGSIIVHGAKLKQATGTKRGHGMLKIIWKHGQKSAKDKGLMVTRSDVLALPEVIRTQPTASNAKEGKPATMLEWQRKRHDGKVVFYAVSKFNGSEDGHVVTIYVDDPDLKMKKSELYPLSEGMTRSKIPDSALSFVRLSDGSLASDYTCRNSPVKPIPLLFIFKARHAA